MSEQPDPVDLTARRRRTTLTGAVTAEDGKARRTENTFRLFETFCNEHGFSALPTDEMTVRIWLYVNRHQWKRRSMEAYRTRINNVHREAGHPPPCGPETTTFINNVTGEDDIVPKVNAILVEDVADLLAHSAGKALSQRDAQIDAYIAVGVLTALRHEDLSRIRAEHITLTPDGYRIVIPTSKHRPDGFDIFLPHESPGTPCTPAHPCGTICPVANLTRHLNKRDSDGRTDGYLFTAPRSRNAYERRQATRDLVNRWRRVHGATSGVSTRSLRVGGATSAREAGIPLKQIQEDLLGHRSPDTTLLYLRDLRTRGIVLTEWE